MTATIILSCLLAISFCLMLLFLLLWLRKSGSPASTGNYETFEEIRDAISNRYHIEKDTIRGFMTYVTNTAIERQLEMPSVKFLSSPLLFHWWFLKYRCHLVFEDSWCEDASRWFKRKKEKYIDHPRFERRMRKQRAERGFSEKDTWDVDDWLTTVLPSMIEEFYKNMHTTPLAAEAFIKGADPFKFTFTSDIKITPELSRAMDRWWEDHLREIVFHLREANYETCSLRNKFEEENHWTPEYEKKIYRYRHKQFQKAMNMLALVFGNLND